MGKTARSRGNSVDLQEELSAASGDPAMTLALGLLRGGPMPSLEKRTASLRLAF
jgi:hypothetical protein